MPHHRRVEEPDRYYLLSNRTHQGQYLLRPDAECRRIIKGCLAREVDRKEVDLVSYCFLSNHFHLVARFPEANRGAFMRDFQGELADRVNDHRGRSETVFPAPYHPETILDGEQLLEKIGYTVNNAVRHGLVTHPEAWPGVVSIGAHRSGGPLSGEWLDHNEWYNLSRRQKIPPRSRAMVEHSVELHVPEVLPGDETAERRRAMLERIERDRKRFCRDAGLDRHQRPENPEYYSTRDWRTEQNIDEEWCNIRRACAGSDGEAVSEYLESRREIDERYREAANAWKRGQQATFPVGTYPPGRARPEERQVARDPPDRAA